MESKKVGVKNEKVRSGSVSLKSIKWLVLLV